MTRTIDSAPQALQSTRTQNSNAAIQGSTTEAFKDYISKPVAQWIREQYLEELGLTEEDVKAMPPEQQQAITDKICNLMKGEQAQAAHTLLNTRCNPSGRAALQALRYMLALAGQPMHLTAVARLS